jgi:hypothetical protein
MGRRKKDKVVLYICDRKACGDFCPNRMCEHTTDIDHAANFDRVTVKPGVVDYFEVVATPGETTTDSNQLSIKF